MCCVGGIKSWIYNLREMQPRPQVGSTQPRLLKLQFFHLSLHQLGPLLKMIDLPTYTHIRFCH